MSFAVSISSVVLTWIVLSVVFIGLGLLLCRLTGVVASVRTESASACLWLGWSTSILFLQLWHFFLPVDGRTLLLCAAFAAVGFVAHRSTAAEWFADLSRAWRKQEPRTRWGVLIAAGLAVLWIASWSMGPPWHYDTGLYHMQGVRWCSEFRLVPGLGNLHGRLAFNNSTFLCAAMLDVGIWSHKSHHISFGYLALSVILPMIAAVPAALKACGVRWIYSLLQMLLLPAAIFWTYKCTSSLQPDPIGVLLGLVISMQMLGLLLCAEGDQRERHFRVLVICCLSAAGLTVKLAFAPFGFASAVLAIFLCLWRDHRHSNWTSGLRVCLTGCVFATVLIGTWMIRGVILSGYVAYPQSFGGFDVSWRIPLKSVAEMHDVIKAWALDRNRPPEEVLRDWQWLPVWLKTQSRDAFKAMIPLVITVTGVLLVWRMRANFVWSRGQAICWLLLLPPLISVLVMLATIPDPRLAGASPWVVAAGLIALILNQLNRSTLQFQRALRWTAVVTAGLLVIVLLKATRYTQGPWNSDGFAPIPKVTLQVVTTESGLQLNVPVEGDQAWDAPLPSTTGLNSTTGSQPQLHLRVPGQLVGGFVSSAYWPTFTATAMAERPGASFNAVPTSSSR